MKSIPIQRTRNATTQAMAHCSTATTSAARTLPISRRTAAIAATQGVYSRVNTRNTKAVKGVNRLLRFWGRVAMVEPVSTARLLTTASLAVKPVTSAVATRQSPKPRGANSGASSPPSMASRLWDESVTTFSRASKVCKNQIRMDARKITVKARVRKSLALSQISWPTFLALGSR